MPSDTGNRAARRALQIVRILGYFVYLAAFFLPAIRYADSSGQYVGYICAGATLINTLHPAFWKSREALAILSGWINPLMLLYVAFLFSRGLRMPRRIISALVLLFMIGTWIYFYLARLAPLIGHWMWIAGILMILAGEIVAPKRTAA